MSEMGIIHVPSGYSFDQRKEAGNYNWVSPNISEELFPVDRSQFGDWDWRYFTYTVTMSTEKVTRHMLDEDWFPAQSGHILTFGVTNPDEQWKYTIPALGTIRNQHCIILHGGNGQRLLNISSSRLGWGPYTYFLAVRHR